ncbi:MAG: hypothetical protein COZ54_00120 [Anaerolineae bacterium CG_4_8_14_3_um_filter_59_70]|nr:MAG: hypothetical protein COZ54_00120 [Anaerolineae bacterium CG_4_8_14_3_um_filter_59_70]
MLAGVGSGWRSVKSTYAAGWVVGAGAQAASITNMSNAKTFFIILSRIALNLLIYGEIVQ